MTLYCRTDFYGIRRYFYSLFDKELRRIVKTDSKAIANIILNMYFGKMPSDSCGFCEIFGLKEKGCCKDDLRCTDCIDNFLRQHYLEE